MFNLKTKNHENKIMVIQGNLNDYLCQCYLFIFFQVSRRNYPTRGTLYDCYCNLSRGLPSSYPFNYFFYLSERLQERTGRRQCVSVIFSPWLKVCILLNQWRSVVKLGCHFLFRPEKKLIFNGFYFLSEKC